MTPYKTREELPEPIKEHLPADAQDIYQEAFNNAWRQFADPAKLNPRRGSSSFVVALLRRSAGAATFNDPKAQIVLQPMN